MLRELHPPNGLAAVLLQIVIGFAEMIGVEEPTMC